MWCNYFYMIPESATASVGESTAQMEEKKKQFDSMLELKTEQKTEELEANMEHEKAAALEKLREETKKQLAGMQHKYAGAGRRFRWR